MTAAQREVEQASERFEKRAQTAAVQCDTRRAEAEQLYTDAVKAADVGLAASGEYELARMVGINQYVARRVR
ncbi:hypothetical protein ACFU9X_38065 [Streptomyces atratus]|uniref:hypothetical protein n=1 Tax=Streptomyces atratus TaxID=1893 RepID=UPI0036A9336D